MINNAFELDGRLIPHGKRLLDLSFHELLSFAFSELVNGADGPTRRRIQKAMWGKLGETGGEIVDDPDLPESMQGVEAPDWWSSDEDPMAEGYFLANTQMG